MYIYIYIYIYAYILYTIYILYISFRADKKKKRARPIEFQCLAEVVVAGVVVAKALFWTDIVTVFGLLVTDFAQSDYDHFSYCVVPQIRSLGTAPGPGQSMGAECCADLTNNTYIHMYMCIYIYRERERHRCITCILYITCYMFT